MALPFSTYHCCISHPYGANKQCLMVWMSIRGLWESFHVVSWLWYVKNLTKSAAKPQPKSKQQHMKWPHYCFPPATTAFHIHMVSTNNAWWSRCLSGACGIVILCGLFADDSQSKVWQTQPQSPHQHLLCVSLVVASGKDFDFPPFFS